MPFFRFSSCALLTARLPIAETQVLVYGFQGLIRVDSLCASIVNVLHKKFKEVFIFYRKPSPLTNSDFLKMFSRIVGQMPLICLIFVDVPKIILAPIESTDDVFCWDIVPPCHHSISHTSDAHFRGFEKKKDDCNYISGAFQSTNYPLKSFSRKGYFDRKSFSASIRR